VTELIRNVPVQDALDGWAIERNNQTFGRVLSRALVGELLLDISASQLADPASGFRQGDILAIASQVDNAGKRLLVAYTDNDRLAAANGENARSLGQPAVAVLQQAIIDYDGIVIDPGHAGVFIAYTDELRRGVGRDPMTAARIATDLTERSRPVREVLDEVAAAPVYIAAEVIRSAEGEVQGVRVQLATGADGVTLSPVFTTPAQVWAWAPTLEARETRLANVAGVALDDGHAGIIIDPAGPSLTLPADALPALAAGERA
jgi:hypothetical protein